MDVTKVAEVEEEDDKEQPRSREEAASAPKDQRPPRRHSSSGGAAVPVAAAVGEIEDSEKAGIAGIVDEPKIEQRDRNKKREGGLVVEKGMPLHRCQTVRTSFRRHPRALDGE